MKRFLIGLAAGGVSSGVTWLFTGSAAWTAIVGLTVAVVIWLSALKGVLSAIFDAFEDAMLR